MTTVAVGVSSWTDPKAWARFVDGSPQGSVFCRPEMLTALDRRVEIVRVGEGDQPRAAAVLFRDATGALERSPLPFCLYQGVLLPPETAAMPAHRRVHEVVEAVAALLEGLEGAERLAFCLHHTFPDLRPFSWFHYHAPEAGQFRIDVRYTGLIAVDPAGGPESVLAHARSVRRQEYRKASARFEVAPSTDLDLLDDLHQRTFDRQGMGRPPGEPALLRSMARAAIAGGFGELLVARDDGGNPAAAVLFLYDRGTAYYLVAANDPAYRSAGVSTLLLLAGIERGLARGVRSIDVVGMNSPARGDFKASFGAVPVPYYVVTWERP